MLVRTGFATRCLYRAAAAAVVCLLAGYARGDPPAPPRDDASAVLSQALAADEARLGPADPALLPILGRLAELRYQAADIAEAMALRRRALKIAIGAYGSLAVPAAVALAALASLYIEGQRYLDAEPLLIAAGQILTSRPGADDPALAAVLAGRASIALARGHKRRAREWAEQAVAIDNRNEGAPRSGRLRALGAVLAAEEEFAQSERILRQAVALDRAAGDEPAEARSLAQLANAYLRQKRFADALPPIEQAIMIDQRRLGPNHPAIADDLYGLGLVYSATDRVADARAVFQAAVDLLNRGASRGTPRLAYIELELARAERKLGHEPKAQSLFEDAQGILNAAAGEEEERERRI